MSFKPNILYYPDTGGSGGDGGNDGEDGGKPGDDGKNAGGNKNQRTFTQEELDDIISSRLHKASEGAIKDVLGKAGVKTVDELVTALADAKKLKDGQLSELDKARADLKDAQDKLNQAEAEKATALAQANERLMKAAVLAEATAKGFRPEAINDVWLVIDRTKIKEKDGEFEGVSTVVEDVAKAKPFWLKTDDKKAPRGTPPGPDGKKPEGEGKTPEAPTNKIVRF